MKNIIGLVIEVGKMPISGFVFYSIDNIDSICLDHICLSRPHIGRWSPMSFFSVLTNIIFKSASRPTKIIIIEMH